MNYDNNNQHFFNLNFKDKTFWKIFFLVNLIILFLVIYYGPRGYMYMPTIEYFSISAPSNIGYRPIGYPLILYTLSLFFKSELLVYLAIYLNGIFFSFIYSTICLIAKKNNSGNFINYSIFFIFLCPLFYEVFVIRETLFYAFLLFVIILNFERWKNINFLYGFLLGLLYITRPTGIVGILSFSAITFFLMIFKKEKNFKYFNRVFIAFLITIIPWITILYFKYNHFLPTGSCTGYLNIFKGLSSIKSNAYFFADVDGIDKFLGPRSNLGCANINYYKNLTLELINNYSFFDLIKSFIYKFLLIFFSYPPIGTADLVLSDNFEIIVKNFKVSIFRVFVSIVGMTLGSLFLFVMIKRFYLRIYTKIDFFLIFICLGHLTIYSITFPEARFRFPIDVFLIIYLLFPIDKNDNLKNIFLFIKILINKKIKNFF